MNIISTILISCVYLFSTTSAHNIGGMGFESGIIHPFLGLDHLLVMITVGILGTQIKQKSIWQLPLCFVSFMILGGVLGINNLELPFMELAITFSIFILGLMIFFEKNISLISYLIIGFFAIFHGNAHGLEIPQIIYPTLYILGFILSTILLHISGILIKKFTQKNNLTTLILKYSGIGISMIGFYLLIS